MKKSSMKGFYIQSEAKKGFKDWTKSALEFTLRNYKLPAKIEGQIKQKIKDLED